MYWLSGDDQRETPRDLQPGQRDNERLEPETGRDETLNRTERGAAGDNEQDRRDQSPTGGRHDGCGQHAREAQKRADRKIDPRGDDDERHAHGDDPGLRHRAHDIGHVVGSEKEDMAMPARREDDPADRNQNEADHALKTNRDGEEIDPAPRGGPRSGGGVRGRCVIHGLHPRSTRPPPGLHARRRRREIRRPCGLASTPRPDRRDRAVPAFRSTR